MFEQVSEKCNSTVACYKITTIYLFMFLVHMDYRPNEQALNEYSKRFMIWNISCIISSRSNNIFGTKSILRIYKG